MERSPRGIRTHPTWRVAASWATIATIAALGMISSGPAGAAALPNACGVLRTAHPQSIMPGHAASGAYTPQNTPGYAGCSVKVGALTVYPNLTTLPPGGSGGVAIKSTTHPRGLGAGDVLLVGTIVLGGPFDQVTFTRAGVHAFLTANGAAPARLVALARRVYARI